MTSVGWFWMALWAFVLGYAVSASIQVFVTRERMRRHLGEDDLKSLSLATLFGFISSSCSFAAIATSRALFRKGAGFISSLAFLLASTNLVIELGVVIAVFLSWHFVVAEYVGGLLLIALTAAVVWVSRPTRWIAEARERGEAHMHDDDPDPPPILERVTSLEGWRAVARAYHAEWGMVWKDVLLGFTVAGVISAFVPRAFFAWLFPGSGSADIVWWEVGLQALVAPVAAFLTFIGSMGNIPLAAVLHANGVSFAGVMAFLFSDLVVLPALRIQARYHGWKVALYILGVFMIAIVGSALLMHAGYSLLDLLPQTGTAPAGGQDPFQVDLTLGLDLLAVAATGLLAWLSLSGQRDGGDHDHDDQSSDWIETSLKALAPVATLWLLGGIAVGWLGWA